ncbi:MAG: TlpA family protein disulfide reductase [Deltaproteobacteria bacterium]|nr:TlpA family protein disulfide reductase [Deltaproteobacteria bacterium]
MRSFKGLTLIITIFAAGFLLAGCKKAGEAEKPGVRETSQAPLAVQSQQAVPFGMRSFDGKEFFLEGLRGKPVVVNFFASWCGPCQLEAPALRDAWAEFGDRVEFVAVAIDDSEEGARGFVRDFKLEFTAGLDADGEIAKAYNIYAIPRTYIIDRTGMVLYEHSGVITKDILDAAIKRAL